MGLEKMCERCKERKPLKEFQLASANGRAKIAPPTRKCLKCLAELAKK